MGERYGKHTISEEEAPIGKIPTRPYLLEVRKRPPRRVLRVSRSGYTKMMRCMPVGSRNEEGIGEGDGKDSKSQRKNDSNEECEQGFQRTRLDIDRFLLCLASWPFFDRVLFLNNVTRQSRALQSAAVGSIRQSARTLRSRCEYSAVRGQRPNIRLRYDHGQRKSSLDFVSAPAQSLNFYGRMSPIKASFSH